MLKDIFNPQDDMDKEENMGPEEPMIDLELEDGTTMTCAVLTILKVRDQEYIVLMPMDDDQAPAEEDGDVFLYRFSLSDDNEPVLDQIEDDEEFDEVSDAFDEWLDNQDFEDMLGDDEDEDEE